MVICMGVVDFVDDETLASVSGRAQDLVIRVSILMYHSIDSPTSTGDPRYSCSPKRFSEHMAYLRDSKRDVVSLGELKDFLQKGIGINRNSVVITFDDGFLDNYTNALPILEQYQYPATIFVAGGFVADGQDGTPRKTFMGRDMLAWNEIKEMQRRGVTFGAHTINHPRLPDVSPSEAKVEINVSKRQLEDQLGKEVEYFAYPYGLYDLDTKTFVKQAGYKLACSTRSGFNNARTDAYALRRIEVYGTDPVWKLSQKLMFGITDATVMFPLTYYTRRLAARLTRSRL
jgi:peptidoglycan/xylan/chitin deacetylase (PgdA/CDA1 family)